MEKNIITLTDSYKVTHHKQYPPKTEIVYSYFESRGGEFEFTKFFGLQYFLKEYLEGVVVTKEKIQTAKKLFQQHFGRDDLFNEAGWNYILEAHGGKLPVSIHAVAEGTEVEVKNVLMTVENTDPKCFWLTNYLETLLVQVWYPTTVCTLSKAMKNLILDYLERTGDPSLVGFKLHDFGFRGVSSVESAGLGSAAHLVNFMGTDTVPGLELAMNYYHSTMPGFSIPAAEHSTITSWGKANEEKAFENMLTQFGTGMVAVVSDSYDIYNACANLWGTKLKNKVCFMEGSLVIRPDSGTPKEVVLECLKILGDKFGTSTNAKGYKMLAPKVRLIQGDGIEYESTKEILAAMTLNGWSTDNVAFGMGGGLLQKVNRDTQKFAFKCSWAQIAGQGADVFKQPATDPGKNSKKGKLKLVNGRTVSISQPGDNQLVEVFRNGHVIKEYTFQQIREK